MTNTDETPLTREEHLEIFGPLGRAADRDVLAAAEMLARKNAPMPEALRDRLRRCGDKARVDELLAVDAALASTLNRVVELLRGQGEPFSPESRDYRTMNRLRLLHGDVPRKFTKALGLAPGASWQRVALALEQRLRGAGWRAGVM